MKQKDISIYKDIVRRELWKLEDEETMGYFNELMAEFRRLQRFEKKVKSNKNKA